jgi:hypothetical protein
MMNPMMMKHRSTSDPVNLASTNYFERSHDQAAIVELHSALELRGSSWMSRINPYIKAIAHPSKRSTVTSLVVKGGGSEPIFESAHNNILFLSLEATDVAVKLEVYSGNSFFSDEYLGFAQVTLPGHHGIDEAERGWCPLDQGGGKLNVSIIHLDSTANPLTMDYDALEPGAVAFGGTAKASTKGGNTSPTGKGKGKAVDEGSAGAGEGSSSKMSAEVAIESAEARAVIQSALAGDERKIALVAFYFRYDPAAIRRIDKIVQAYSEDELAAAMKEKYGETPADTLELRRDALTDFYEEHDVTALRRMDKIICSYGEEELEGMMMAKYGACPERRGPEKLSSTQVSIVCCRNFAETSTYAKLYSILETPHTEMSQL